MSLFLRFYSKHEYLYLEVQSEPFKDVHRDAKQSNQVFNQEKLYLIKVASDAIRNNFISLFFTFPKIGICM